MPYAGKTEDVVREEDKLCNAPTCVRNPRSHASGVPLTVDRGVLCMNSLLRTMK